MEHVNVNLHALLFLLLFFRLQTVYKMMLKLGRRQSYLLAFLPLFVISGGLILVYAVVGVYIVLAGVVVVVVVVADADVVADAVADVVADVVADAVAVAVAVAVAAAVPGYSVRQLEDLPIKAVDGSTIYLTSVLFMIRPQKQKFALRFAVFERCTG